MKKKATKTKVSAPGRICLFGEHQDYLNLPVIPCAISLRISIEGTRRNDLTINLDLPDINDTKSLNIARELPYDEERDYFRSVLNVLHRKEFTFSTGFDCLVRGDIPINAGTSSSSALIVAWVNFLAKMSDQAKALTPEEIANYAYMAEVLEFSEPGGMMDHYSSALGEIIFLDSRPEITVEKINADLKSFVLGDSGEPKDTKSILARVKKQVIDVTKMLTAKYPGFSLRKSTPESIKKYSYELTDGQLELLVGTVRNYQITLKARREFEQKPLDHKKIGELLNEHQRILRDILKISIPKIDRMIDAALAAGAYGAKINGSGGGGCMFAYAPENTQEVVTAIEAEGGVGYIVDMDAGVCVNSAQY